PAGLDAIILKCLTKKPEGRYANMGELVADLDKLEKGVLPDAVGEMMARSGGFNVAADYCRTGGMPAAVPGAPRLPTRRWPLIAAVTAGATVVGIALAIIIKSNTTTAQPIQPVPTQTTAPPVATAPATATQAATTASAVATTPPVVKKQVMV